MIVHDLFADKLTAVLVRAGLPIAATYDPSLCAGVHVEVDDESDPPVVFLSWWVHPTVNAHFLSLAHDQLLADPQVRMRQTTVRAMHTAITVVLEAAGYQVREGVGEAVGQLIVTATERPLWRPAPVR